jgi:hypothetical protein
MPDSEGWSAGLLPAVWRCSWHGAVCAMVHPPRRSAKIPPASCAQQCGLYPHLPEANVSRLVHVGVVDGCREANAGWVIRVCVPARRRRPAAGCALCWWCPCRNRYPFSEPLTETVCSGKIIRPHTACRWAPGQVRGAGGDGCALGRQHGSQKVHAEGSRQSPTAH